MQKVDRQAPLGPGSLACIRCKRDRIVTRGCCRNCYMYFFKEVRAGRQTWELLEGDNKVLPAKKARILTIDKIPHKPSKRRAADYR